MIDTAFARTMARYGRWQNRSLVAAAGTLTDAERWMDRGAFFRSIAETLNHILWDDRIWLARLWCDDAVIREIGARHPYTEAPRDWLDYAGQRKALDDEIVAWADRLTEADLSQAIRWVRGGERVETEFGFKLVHMMNHQTHHRGQVHAMLTAAGTRPEPTDLQMLEKLGG